jgi:hypothetical protein
VTDELKVIQKVGVAERRSQILPVRVLPVACCLSDKFQGVSSSCVFADYGTC